VKQEGWLLLRRLTFSAIDLLVFRAIAYFFSRNCHMDARQQFWSANVTSSYVGISFFFTQMADLPQTADRFSGKMRLNSPVFALPGHFSRKTGTRRAL
jgi:hypothetical protein